MPGGIRRKILILFYSRQLGIQVKKQAMRAALKGPFVILSRREAYEMLVDGCQCRFIGGPNPK